MRRATAANTAPSAVASADDLRLRWMQFQAAPRQASRQRFPNGPRLLLVSAIHQAVILCVPKTSHGDFRVKEQKIISA
jgi:hypothetical protein